MSGPTTDWVVLWSVVLVQFLAPLFIAKYPLPAILTCLVVDGVDQSVLQAFTSLDLAEYQSYDKALDIFYLAIAMLATLRNWASYPAVQIARFLFYFRLVGVVLFVLIQWRPLLLLFPNTFEYFFIFYEVVRSRWTPTRLGTRFWIVAATVIWVVFKLPHEYWIHVAQLDATDVVKDVVFGGGADVGWSDAIARQPVAFALLVAAMVAAIIAVRTLVGRVAPPSTHALTLAAAPLPDFIDEAQERDRRIAKWRLFDMHLMEKIVLVGCVTVIFAQVLPGVDASPLQRLRGAAIVVTINAFVRIRLARASRSRESAILSFVLLLAINMVIVALSDWLLRRREGSLDIPSTLFFLLLLTLIVTLYDRWHPVFDARFSERERG